MLTSATQLPLYMVLPLWEVSATGFRTVKSSEEGSQERVEVLNSSHSTRQHCMQQWGWE